MRPNEPVVRVCEQCRRAFTLTGHRLAMFLSHLRGMKVDYSARFCSRGCTDLSNRSLPRNRRGEGFCLAPVPDGCDGARAVKRRARKLHSFCAAHLKRAERGMAMNEPIVRRPGARAAPCPP